MTIMKCDRCKKIINPGSPYSKISYTDVVNPYHVTPNAHFDLCFRCTELFKSTMDDYKTFAEDSIWKGIERIPLCPNCGGELERKTYGELHCIKCEKHYNPENMEEIK